ncbi:hypothetical protein NC651_031518 [Populus alba x Populus x berolinensis]|nr:hypothetical protein NC651_031518 [Populus alba x Populus x berolinensis]
METPSELVGGDQNDQAVQPLAADQNNQSIQPSATEIKKANKRASDKKYRHGKKQKMENIQRQFEELKADCAELVKRESSSQVILNQLNNDLEQARADKRLQGQIVEQQNLIINILLQLLSIEMTGFGTGATRLSVHHPPVYQSGTTMESEGPVIEESLGLPQSHLLQGWAHGNNVEQPALTYDDDLFVSLNHLFTNYPPRTAMAPGSSPMQGSLAPQGQGNNSEQPASANDDQFPDVH